MLVEMLVPCFVVSLEQVQLKIKTTPINILLIFSFSTLTSVNLNEVFLLVVMWVFLS